MQGFLRPPLPATGMVSLQTQSLATTHWVGIVLAAVSGTIHLVIGIGDISSGLGVSFVLAGLGFFGAIALVLVDYRRRLVYAVGIPFVAAQIVIWYVLNGFPLDPTEIVDKAAQIGLIVVLVVLLREG